MDAEVDQSGRIEEVRPTVLAVSNDQHRSILIPAAVKREVFGRLRRRGESSKRATVRIFAAALYLLLMPVIDPDSWIVVDLEYPGYETLIKSMLLRWLRRIRPGTRTDQIRFRRIGKASPAHQIAMDTYQGKLDPDKVVTVRQLMTLFEEKK